MLKKFILLFMSVMLLSGCSMQSDDNKKLEDVEFTVLSEDEIPDELKTQIEEKKQEEFKLTYSDDTNLYIARGYGKQERGGYSISVDELYFTENAVFMKTSLIGPSASEQVENSESFPYVVVKMELTDKNVVFE